MHHKRKCKSSNSASNDRTNQIQFIITAISLLLYTGQSFLADAVQCHITWLPFRASEPTNFLLFADLNTIKMLHLDNKARGQTEVRTLHFGEANANYVALSFDDSSKIIYWSDLYRCDHRDMLHMQSYNIHVKYILPV